MLEMDTVQNKTGNVKVDFKIPCLFLNETWSYLYNFYQDSLNTNQTDDFILFLSVDRFFSLCIDGKWC